MDPTCSASVAPAGLTVQVCFPGARAAVLDNLNRQREEGRLCDLSIQVQGQVFRAHRCVLAASSPYFHDQVLLKNVTTVSLPSVMDPVAFESVLSSAYTGQLSIVHDDIVNYVTVASFLQMWHIVDKCTEILKRPRSSADVASGEAAAAHPGPASRQQSPSSTECLYAEREGRRREKKPDALPPLATWRRPQQFPRWGRPRPSPAQQSADSQLDALLVDGDYSGCSDEAWASGHARTAHFPQEGPGHTRTAHFPQEGPGHARTAHFPQEGPGHTRTTHFPQEGPGHTRTAHFPQEGPGHTRTTHFPQEGPGHARTAHFPQEGPGHARTAHFPQEGPGHGARFPAGDAPKQKARFQQRGASQSGDRANDRSRDEDDEEPPDRRKNQKREIEADEGVGEEAVEKKEGFAPLGHCDFHSVPDEHQDHSKQSVEVMKDKSQRDLVGPDPSSDPSSVHGCPAAEGVSGPPCLVSARLPWPSGPWNQADGEGGGKDEEEEEEEDVDFECLSEAPYGRDTYDEIEDGTGQVSQRPLVPASPDFLTGSEVSWTGGGQTGSVTPSSSAFPPAPSPPTPSSSSSVSLAGAPYTGKVHFCHCGKAYTLKSMRDRHVKMQHLNLRPFGCPVCTKSFKMKHHLTKHLKTHGGLRPYECSLCGKKVIWRDSFLRHQARCQRLASTSSTSNTTNTTAAADVEENFGYSLDDGDAFLPAGGQVKVEEADFQRDMGDGMGRLLHGVSRMVDVNLEVGGHVFKQEVSESFSGN